MTTLSNKKKLIQDFIHQLENELEIMKAAAIATHEAAISEEAKPENEYDTRALEASYLAKAQDKRVAELREVITLLRKLMFKDFAPTDSIDLTALVKIKLDGKPSTVLVLPAGGGVSLEHNSVRVSIVTPQSVLGETIMGLHIGDHIEFEIGQQTRECEILAIE
jgi:transcription elongation GreA/GreB family factor